MRGPMTIRAWLDLRAGIGKVVKNLKISFENLLGKVRNIFGNHGFSWKFSNLKNLSGSLQMPGS